MQIVVLSTYPPRRCGLATFTADLRAALSHSVPHWQVAVAAIDRDGLGYGPEVVEVLRQDERAEYRRVARALAATGVDLVVIQHEYGIFGGPDGHYLLDFVAELTRLAVPYAVTAHTVRGSASAGQAGALAGVCRGAARVTGFTGSARQVAADAGWVEPARFRVVPHGVPVALTAPAGDPPIGPALTEALAATAGRRLLSTFGLLRRSKGLETVITALPEIVARHPDVVYLVAGATHPETIRRNGESYRAELAALAQRLGVAEQVRFVDAFLTEPELAVLLQRTALYLTPYRSAEQTCSGALTFALAAGAPVVSTAYPYARELVTPSEGPALGALVPADDPAALAGAVCGLLADPAALAATRQAARARGAQLSWPAVGATFAEVFAAAAGGARRASSVSLRPAPLPELVDRAGGAPAAAGGEPWSRDPTPPASTGQPS